MILSNNFNPINNQAQKWKDYKFWWGRQTLVAYFWPLPPHPFLISCLLHSHTHSRTPLGAHTPTHTFSHTLSLAPHAALLFRCKAVAFNWSWASINQSHKSWASKWHQISSFGASSLFHFGPSCCSDNCSRYLCHCTSHEHPSTLFK